jgi:hypothetical protein
MKANKIPHPIHIKHNQYVKEITMIEQSEDSSLLGQR